MGARAGRTDRGLPAVIGRARRALVLALALVAAPAVGQAPEPAPELRILLKPGALDPAAGTATLDVTMTVPAMTVAAGQPLFSQQNMAPRMKGPVELADLTVTDSAGAVPIVTDGKNGQRGWSATRAVSGDVTIRYRALIDNARDSILSSTPHVDGPGLFGIGNMLIVAPNVDSAHRVAIDWDLSALPPGSKAVSTFGDGNVRLPAGSLSRLTFAMYMAGDIKREPEAATGGFSANWTGEPTFDIRSAMRWSQQLYHFMSRYFADPEEPLYHVFLRRSEMNAGNGVAAPHAFSLSFGPKTTAEGVKTILGHEMTHTWTVADIGKWYSEGNAVYYQARLSWLAGMIPTDQYLADINLTAARYYSNTAMGAPDADIVPRFWEDSRYNVLAYDRGALYFATLDAMIRHRSQGRRSIDDPIRAMVDLARKDQPITEATWTGLLQGELGAAGPTLHRAMMVGERIVPPSDAYGPCFRRVAAKVRPVDLGFGEPALRLYKKVVGLRAGSEAANAGLQEGDEVDYSLGTEAILRQQDALLTVKVTRGEQRFTVSYLPRGAPVDGFRWERVPAVPESRCRPAPAINLRK